MRKMHLVSAAAVMDVEKEVFLEQNVIFEFFNFKFVVNSTRQSLFKKFPFFFSLPPNLYTMVAGPFTL